MTKSEDELRKELAEAKVQLDEAQNVLDSHVWRCNELKDQLAVVVCPFSVGDDVMRHGYRFQVVGIARATCFGDDYMMYGKKYKKNGELYKNTSELYGKVTPAEA